jgi:hypothetical protein
MRKLLSGPTQIEACKDWRDFHVVRIGRKLT